MLNIAELSLLPSATPAPIDRNDPAATALEFDTLLLEIFLQHGGLLRSLTSAGDAQAPVFGELFLHGLAQDLARQMNLGFGNLVVAQTQQSGGRG
jgi:hypothetical protein